jgi:hypothetical protein
VCDCDDDDDEHERTVAGGERNIHINIPGQTPFADLPPSARVDLRLLVVVVVVVVVGTGFATVVVVVVVVLAGSGSTSGVVDDCFGWS